jgi:hypothetical protein
MTDLESRLVRTVLDKSSVLVLALALELRVERLVEEGRELEALLGRLSDFLGLPLPRLTIASGAMLAT